MSAKIAEHINKHLNTELVSTIENIPEGFVKMRVKFKIDTLGKVFDIKVRAPHIKLEEEVIRVIKLVPNLIRPGIMDKNPVIVTYGLPIVIENYPSKKSKKKRKKKN
jgi:protein TonB